MQNRWDSEGNYYNPDPIPDVAGRDLHYPNLPYRLAHEIQDHVVREVSLSEYFTGIAERQDIALDYVTEILSQVIEPPTLAWDALNIWHRVFGKDLRNGRVI